MMQDALQNLLFREHIRSHGIFRKKDLVHQEACSSDQSSGLPEEELLVLDLTLVSSTSREAQACLILLHELPKQRL